MYSASRVVSTQSSPTCAVKHFGVGEWSLSLASTGRYLHFQFRPRQEDLQQAPTDGSYGEVVATGWDSVSYLVFSDDAIPTTSIRVTRRGRLQGDGGVM